MLTISREYFISYMQHNYDLAYLDAKCVVDDMVQMYIDLAVAGHNCNIRKVGKFVVNHKVSRPGRNPKTGEDIQILARKTLILVKSGAPNAKGVGFCVRKQIEYMGKLGYMPAPIKDLLGEFHKVIAGVLKGIYRVELRGLGTFELRVLAAGRTCHNPKTMEKLVSKERRKIHYRMGRTLLRALNPEQEFHGAKRKES